MKSDAFFIIFKGLLMKQIKEGESPTLSTSLNPSMPANDKQ